MKPKAALRRFRLNSDHEAAAEMNEGPEALARFEETMKALFSKRKADVLPEKRTKDKPQPKSKTR